MSEGERKRCKTSHSLHPLPTYPSPRGWKWWEVREFKGLNRYAVKTQMMVTKIQSSTASRGRSTARSLIPFLSLTVRVNLGEMLRVSGKRDHLSQPWSSGELMSTWSPGMDLGHEPRQRLPCLQAPARQPPRHRSADPANCHLQIWCLSGV